MEIETRLALDPRYPVFMASGQGSQKPGMGADLLSVKEVADTVALAHDVFERDIAALLIDASSEELNDTRNSQAAIAALSIGIGRALIACGIKPSAVLGFSLGQISALALTGMVSDRVAFEIIKHRSEFMAQAADKNPGCMSAFMKGTREEVEQVVAEAAEDDVLVAANYNCPGQVVVSGTPEAVARAEERWASRGYRSARLATSGAFHSPLMAEAAARFGDYLETISFNEAAVPLINNVDEAPLQGTQAREMLVAHLTGPVRFEESVQLLADAGATEFVEVGFGGVLTGLVRRIDPSLTRVCIQDKTSFDNYLAAWQETHR